MNYLEKILATETRETGIFFEDIIFGAFKKHQLENNRPIFSYVVSGEFFTNTKQELLDLCKEVGLETFYKADFWGEVVDEVQLENSNHLLMSANEIGNFTTASHSLGFFTYNIRMKEKERLPLISCKFLSTDEKVVTRIAEFFKAKKKAAEIKKGSIYMLCQNSQGLDTRFIGTDFVPLERGNYSEETLAGYDHVVSEFNKKEPNGCIAIASSTPGTGKTYLIRSLIGEIKESIFVYIPPSMIRDLAGPSLVTCLIDLSEENEKKNIILVLEDADEVLAPRMGDNMSSISTILNLTDGILGKILNIRVIATTNTSEKKFDAAIMRPGRLCANLKLGPLSREQGSKVYERLTGKTEVGFKKEYTLAEIYGMVHNDGKEVETKSNFENKTGF